MTSPALRIERPTLSRQPTLFSRSLLLLATLAVSATLNVSAADYVVTSPDAQTRVVITEAAGQLSYAVKWRGTDIVMPSRLDLLNGKQLEFLQATTSASDSTWKPTWGQFSQIRDNHHAVVLHLKVGEGEEVLLECRVFNDGLGLRFSSGGKVLSSVDQVDFRSEYRLAEKSRLYWSNGERDPIGPVTLAEFVHDAKATPRYPVVVDAGEGAFAAAMESDLFSAKQFSLMKYGHSTGPDTVLVGQSEASVNGEVWQTPWRVILVGRNPGDLLTSTTPLNLAAACQLADTSWIKPGKTMWDWRVHGYQAGEFKYGLDTASYLRFIDFAAANNVQYFLIDDAWFTTAKQGRLEARPEIHLPDIMAHASKRGVRVLLYYDRHKGVLADDVLFPQLAQAGAVGTKYGFMGNKADFTRGAIAAAAQQKLLINFHDGPCPMTGVERTMPNLITREYCHAMLDSRRAYTPTGFLKMAMINGLTGPLDQANGNFGLNGINAGNREKGVRELETYDSTVVSEAARVLVISSGLICLPDAPEEYLKKADLFEFIRNMPATWDDTRILNSRMSELITTARRSGNEWFVGSVINEAGGELTISLDFLEPNTSYDVTFYEDAPDTHFKTNREAYQVRHGTVKQGDTIKARLAPGGGHCLWLRPN